MPQYVDGFVIPIPKKNLAAYKKMAATAGKVWMEHGALAYFECVGEDLTPGFGLPFPKLCKSKPDETIVFSFIVYKSRAQRDRVNKKVMADPRMAAACDPKNMPFEVKKMACGGFEAIVAREAR
jgi:uncharacterized protein YbaA (DUF1428 family)